MHYLSDEQVAKYQQDGYLSPLDLLSEEETNHYRRQYQECRDLAGRSEFDHQGERYFRTNAHIVMPFINQVMRHPKLLDMVESILGRNLLVWSAEFFVKPASSRKIVSWHQDLTYWGLGDVDDELTAWVALSDVNAASGCMRFIPCSHKQQILPHRDTFGEDNLLSRGQEIAVDVDEDKAHLIELTPGQVSFHHGRMFHASGPNTTGSPRIGLAIRYITPAVRQQVAKRDYAMVVRGIDESGNWISVAPPSTNFQPAYLDLHKRVRLEQLEALAQGADQILSTER